MAGARVNIKVVNYLKPEDRKQANFEQVLTRIQNHMKNGGTSVFFDLDLVLANSRKANAASVGALLGEYRLNPVSMPKERFVSICSGSTPHWILTTLVPNLGNQPERLDEMVTRLAEIAMTNIYLIEPTPIAAFLPEMVDAKTAVLTNRKREGAHAVLDHLGIREVFDAIVHQSRLVPPKPDPTMVVWGLALTKTAPKEAIFFDDNKSGLDAAKAVGVRGMLVRWLDGTP